MQEFFHPADRLMLCCNPVQAQQKGLGRGRTGEAGDGPSYHCLDIVEHIRMVLCLKTLWWRRGNIPSACMRCRHLSHTASSSSKTAGFALIFHSLLFFPALCKAHALSLDIHGCQEERCHPSQLPPV